MRAIRYDPMDLTTISNPYPIYDELRAEQPVFWHDKLNSWVFTRYRECREILTAHERFARDIRRLGGSLPDSSISVQVLDPPEQNQLRRLFTSALRKPDIEALTDGLRLDLATRFDDFRRRTGFDFMTEVAEPGALAVMAKLFGITRAQAESLVARSESIVQAMDNSRRPTVARSAQRATEELDEIIRHLRSTSEPGRLIDLINGATGPTSIPQSQVNNTLRAVFLAGYNGLVATSGNIVLAVLEQSNSAEMWTHPQLSLTGVDELIRYAGPVQGSSRVATRDTTVGGTTIRRGHCVLALLAAASRDPDHFRSPHSIILDRAPNPHLAFGHGPHACLGGQLAQLLIRTLISALAAQMPHCQLVGTPVWQPTATLRRMTRLPLAYAVGR